MTKNDKGGKKTRTQKRDNGNDKKREIPISDKSDNSHIAIINKVLGDGRYYCQITDMNGVHDKLYISNLSNGTKKKFCRGIILGVGTHVLISIREFQKEKADIIFAYKDTELNSLVERKEIASIILKDGTSSADLNYDFTEFVDSSPSAVEDFDVI